MRAWTDNSLAAVFCVRGGMGTLRITELLDVEALRAAEPKALIGSSDVTGLHEFWERRLGVSTWFAPMLATKDLLDSQQNIDQLHHALFTSYSGRTVTAPDAVSLVKGEAQGLTTGGNLTLIRQARELERYPDNGSAEGRIVLLEDVGEAPWRLDGQLMGLLRSGYLDGAKRHRARHLGQVREPGRHPHAGRGPAGSARASAGLGPAVRSRRAGRDRAAGCRSAIGCRRRPSATRPDLTCSAAVWLSDAAADRRIRRPRGCPTASCLHPMR